MRVRHVTGYTYADPVTASYNEARMTPQTDPWQLTLDARVETEPRSQVRTYWDYWGNYVSVFDLHEPHRSLTVSATSLVETSTRPSPVDLIDWATLRNVKVAEEHVEMLAATAYAPENDELSATADELVAGANRPVDAAMAVVGFVCDTLTYQVGVTGVHTSAVEAWIARQGVCQDFAHLSLLMLRAIGIPARYVSGYLHPATEIEPNVTATGESHAWVEFWCGEWWPMDPTNGRPVGSDHVLVARGRDYNDVSPLRGIYSGAASTALGVTVEMTALPPGREG
jgi:transglutaminase-like putative cysteine protease